MATFWKDIKNKYSVRTYQDTKNTYDWIIKAINKGNFGCDEVDAEFLFDISSMLCSCHGIDEFIENAYGYDGYKFTQMRLSFCPENCGRVGIAVGYDNKISISSTNKVMMEKLASLLDSTSLDEAEINNPVSLTYIKTQINNDGVIINGDHNTVANNHSEIEVEQKKEEPGIKSFWAGILQNITSNFIWYLLTFGAGIVIAYLTKS